MVEQYLVWVLLVGIALGAAGAWFVMGRLPRRSEDISPPELVAEADWISRTVAERGGVAPVDLVQEVLELHVDYLASEPLDVAPEPAQATAVETDGGAAPTSRAGGAAPTSRAGEPPVERASQPAGEPRGR